jgi:hypothetical protein
MNVIPVAVFIRKGETQKVATNARMIFWVIWQ